MLVAQIPNPDQLALIADQLGRPPQGIDVISWLDHKMSPAVLRMLPLVGNKPFPTLYWLSSNELKVALSKLEAQGLIKDLEQALQQDADFMRAYWLSHLDYVQQRWFYMPISLVTRIRQQNYMALLTQRGIGGLANWQQVRCLHMHYAHHLCGQNVIGRWLDQHFPDLRELC